MLVREYMTPNPLTVTPETTHPEAMRLLREHKIRRLPVMDRGKLVGIVVEKDLLSNQPSPATTLSVYEMYTLLENLQVRQFMSSPVITVGGDCPVEEAARIMVAHKIGCLPIMDEDRLVGIITETDIFKLMMEVLGGQESGIRLTVRLPERVGELARVTRMVADAGGNIIAVTTSRLQENKHREVTIKESGADEETLKRLLAEEQIEVLDLRSSMLYEPRLFG